MTAPIAVDASSQERVFEFLMGLATDPPVHRIDTHAASVFLAGTRALKVKRAVRFAFGLFDAGETQGCLRSGAERQPAVRAANLSPRGSDNPG
jgi:hypothetical protein